MELRRGVLVVAALVLSAGPVAAQWPLFPPPGVYPPSAYPPVYQVYGVPVYGGVSVSGVAGPVAFGVGLPLPFPLSVSVALPLHGSSGSGGVRVALAQLDAEVFVDGLYVGQVGDVNGKWQSVPLEPGPHRVEVRRAGYVPAVFDVNTQPGRTVTYRTPMREAR